jgi:hypothetical protein
MDGAKKAEDKLNTVGIVTVGICGAVLVYVSIVLLQAFYMNETSAVSQITDNYGAQDELRTLRSDQVTSLAEYRRGATPSTATIPVQQAMNAIVAKINGGNSVNLVPGIGTSDKPTVPAVFGHADPTLVPAAPAAPVVVGPDGATQAPTTGAESGAGSATASPPPGTTGGATAAPGTPAPASGAPPSATAPGTPPANPATGGAASPTTGGGAPGQPAPSPGATQGGNGH